MRVSILTSLLAAGCAHAISDSSPFLLFSTAEFSSESPAQLQTSSRVVAAAKDILSGCPTRRYLLVSQPNVHATDLDGPEGCTAHRIRAAVRSDSVRGRYTVAEMVPTSQGGNLSTEDLSAHIEQACAAAGVEEVGVRTMNLAGLPVSPDCHVRAETMDDNDYALGTLLQDELPAGDLTVVFFSTFHDGKPYEADFENPSQLHLKKRIATEYDRPVARQVLGRAATTLDNAPLFVKYQFFTPGIFMGLTVLFILLSVLYVGLASLGSLQVSYGAFDKEMGPSAQKKQA